jgi:hypothetical protein
LNSIFCIQALDTSRAVLSFQALGGVTNASFHSFFSFFLNEELENLLPIDGQWAVGRNENEVVGVHNTCRAAVEQDIDIPVSRSTLSTSTVQFV